MNGKQCVHKGEEGTERGHPQNFGRPLVLLHFLYAEIQGRSGYIDTNWKQGRRWKFVAGGPRLGGLRDGSPPVGSRGEAPVGGSGTKFPRS